MPKSDAATHEGDQSIGKFIQRFCFPAKLGECWTGLERGLTYEVSVPQETWLQSQNSLEVTGA